MMHERRVIDDSEEDDGDEGFSPLNSPSKASITERDDNDRGDGCDGELTRTINDDKDNTILGSTSDARSTDPEFFRRLYESAQRTPVTDVIIPDTAAQQHIRDGQTSSDRQKGSSSITDPPSTRTKRTAMVQIRTENRQLDDCTQVTTPAAPVSGQKDIYDFTLSDEEIPRANNIFAPRKKVEGEKKNKKRKRAFLEDPILDSSSPHIPSAQRATDGERHLKPEGKGRQTLWQTNHSQGLDDVDLLRVTPASSGLREDASHITHTTLPSLQPTSKEPSSASFFIAPPSRLTASQKQEYLRLSDISETERESHYEQASLPPPKPLSGDCLPPNTESSFESATPDRYRLLTAHLPAMNSFDELPTSCASEPRSDALQIGRGDPPFQHDDMEQWQPLSSPDILNEDLPVASTHKLKRKRRVDAGESHTEGEDWDSNHIGYSREQYVPRPSRRRSGVEPSADDGGLKEANATSIRARRQKQQATVKAGQNHDSDSEEVHRNPKRAMPRHRRSRRTGVIEEDEDEDQQDISSMPDTCPPDSFRLNNNDTITEPLLPSPQHEPQEGPSNGLEGLNADFLAALPEEIRQEVIADHLAQQSALNSQTARTRSRRRLVEAPNEQQSLSTNAPQTQKRGRKKKKEEEQEQGSHDKASITAPESEAITILECAVPTKRKRGRPRKSEAAQLIDGGPDAGIYATVTTATENAASALGANAEDDAMETLAGETVIGNAEAEPRKRGRKRKMVEEAASTTRATQPEQEEEGEHAESVDQREPLKDISNSAAQSGSKGGLESLDGDNQQQQLEQEDAKVAVPTAAADPTSRPAPKMTPGIGGPITGSKAPPPLRVGLSKKSRIAPLLKVIRK